MKPVLFEKDNTNYDHNGIAVLYDAISCIVYEEHNGIFDLELEYPIDGEWASFILEDRQILAKPNDVDDPHAFRIYEVVKDLEENVVYVKATSITDDLRGNLITYVSVTDATAQQALAAIKNGLIEETRFDFISDIDKRSAFEATRINPLQVIAGTGGSLLDLYGGDIKRTNDTLYLYSRRGTDHVTVIRPGKNVDGFKMTASTKGIVTKIFPYYTYTPETLPVYVMVDDGNGNMVKQQDYDDQNTSGTRVEPVTVTGAVVESADAHKYPVSQYLPVDYSRDETMNETVELFIELKRLEAEISETPIDVSGFDAELQQFVLDLLNDQAALYFTDNPGIDKASVQFKADMIQLADSDEWELFKNLETINVSDTVDVYVKKFDVDIEVKINAISYDSIGERVQTITAGTTRNTLSQSITKPYEDAVKELEEYIDNMENGVYNTISRTADGQNKRFSGYTEPPASVSSEGDVWYKEVGGGKVELWIYKGGAWVALISAAVSDAIDQAIQNASDAASDADTKAQGIIDNVQGLVLEDGITTLGDLIASKVSEDDYGTLFLQQSKSIGWVYTEGGVDKAIIMINEGIPYIKGEHIILNGDTIVDGTFTVTDTMLAEDAVIKSLVATGIDAETVRVINLDASSIVGGDLEVTESFRITHNGVPVLEVDAVTGQIKITAPNLATKTDLESLELTPGPTGTGIESVTEYYLATASATGVTTGTVGWTTAIQTMDATKKYLWNYEVTTYTDSSTRTTTPVIIGRYGDAGKGISSITEYYLASASSTGVTTSTSGWTTTMQSTTDTNKYLWNYEVITYTDSTTTTIAPVVIGTHGAKGDTGKGVSSVTEYYLASPNNTGVTTATAGWSTSIPTIDTTNKYLWNYEKTTYSDSTTVNSTPVVLGAHGANGKGISSITEYYLATSSATGVTTSTSGWTTAMQTTTETNKYLWNYEVITYTDSTTTTISPVIIGTHGATGSTGKGISGVTEYYLATNVNSGVTTATSGWATTVPTITSSNKYLWNYEKTTYTDSTSVNSTPVLLGAYGDTGKGVTSVTNYYLATAAGSGVTTATTGWTTTMQTMTAINNYLWNYEVITYTDSSTTTTTPAIIGTKGIDGTTTYTWIKYADDAQGNGMSDLPEGKRYLGIAYNKTSSDESTTKTDYSWSPLYDNVQVGGRNLIVGNPNNDKKRVTITNNHYLDIGTTAILEVGQTYTFSWNYEIISADVGIDDTNVKIHLGAGASSIVTLLKTASLKDKQLTFTWTQAWSDAYGDVFRYRLSDWIGLAYNSTIDYWDLQLEKGNIVTDWTAAPEDRENLYTWIKYASDINGTGMSDDPTGKDYIGIAYNKDTATESTTATDYAWALFRGAQGIEGKGLTSITEYYLASTSTSGVTTATSGWTTTMQTTDTTKRYLWNYEKVTYNDSTTTNSTPVIIGTHGATGSAGKGISSITEYYLATSAGTGVTTATAGWTTAVQTTTTTNKYLWNYEVITYTDSTTTTIAPVIIGTHGATGGNGVSVTSIVEEYYRSTSNTSQVGGSWSTTYPAWVDGTYLWTRAKTTFSDATTSTTSAICVTGAKGTDGTTTYTWVKYADDSAGAGLSDSPSGKRYIGIATNKTSSTESATATDYTWSPLFDNVEVGGRNVYLDSFLNKVVAYSNGKVTRTEADLSSGMTSDIIKVEPVDPLATTNFGFYHHSTHRKGQYVGGKNYSLTFKARGNITNFSYCYWMRNSSEGGNSNMGTHNVTLSDTVWTEFTIHDDCPWDTTTGYILIATRDIAAGKWFEVKEVMLEQGNVVTPWTPAPEDIQDILDGKASTSDLEALAGIVSDVSAIANAAAGMGEFQALQEAYNKRVELEIADKEQLALDLATIDGRVTLAHTIAGDAKLVTEFINTVITESEEGIYISNGASNTGILIATDRISFLDNEIEVAFISNQTMKINHGIFVESATIANFKFELIPGTTIMAIQWVGV